MTARRVLRQILYWLAVVLIALALVAGLVLWLDSRDRASLTGGTAPGHVREVKT